MEVQPGDTGRARRLDSDVAERACRPWPAAWTRQDDRPETRRIVEHTAPWGVLARRAGAHASGAGRSTARDAMLAALQGETGQLFYECELTGTGSLRRAAEPFDLACEFVDHRTGSRQLAA